MIGQTLGHYRVGEQLGRGGMGEVYVADDLNLNRKVALKFLPDAFTGDPERMARFEREAKVLASLNHPNIAAIYGLEQAEGKRFLVLELVEGETLAQRLSKGSLPVDEALGICKQIAEGLEAAHEKGVIHRDLKPANVMITEGEKVKILDFGLAKALAGETQSVEASQSPTLTEAMTRPGVILGTAAYMSPEQAKGKAVDKRADIWAFGCILYECLTGKRAFEGETVTETLAAILKGEPEWSVLSQATPPSIQLLLRRCLQKDLSRRFHDAADLRIEIAEAVVSTQELKPNLPVVTSGRRIIFLTLASAGLLAIGSITTWIFKPSLHTTQPPMHLEMNLSPNDSLATVPAVALSPDGHRLVYVAVRSGVQQLFVRSMDSREGKPLPGTEGAMSPFFSPDGRWIGFFATGKLKKISVAGGSALALCDSTAAGGGAWDDDDTIVFSPSATSGLLRVPAAGGKPQIVTTVDRTKGETSHRWPQFLPGNKALLFTVSTGFGWDEFHIAVLRFDTKEIRIVLRGGNTGRFVPTGHLIYYRAGTLLAVPFDPVRLEVTGGTPETVVEGIAQSTGLIGAEYCFSEAGSLAYIPANPRQFECRLVWVDRKGVIEPLSAPVRAYNTTIANGLSLSPSGRQVAVQVISGTREIWIYNIERGMLTRLTTEAGSSQFPIWTPDETRITYMGFRSGLRNIYWKNVDGTSEEERLTTGDNQQIPSSWSPDGKYLAFYEGTTTSGDIWMLQLGGERKQQPFLRTRFNEYAARFSPDGHWLAYQSNESGRDEIYVRQFPGPGTKWQISTEGGGSPCWARNGRELFYRNGNKMMAVNIRTKPNFKADRPRLLFQGEFGAGDIAPDDQRFLMVQSVEPEQPATKIDLVLNWFDELKQKVPPGER